MFSVSSSPPDTAIARQAGWSLPPGGAVATIGAAAGLLGILYLFWPTLKGAGAALFSRTQDEEVLDHPTRRAVAQAIAANPGIHLHEVSRVVGLSRGTVEHHLRKLVAAQQVLVLRSAGYSCYFPKGTGRHVLSAAPATRSDTSQAILAALLANPGASVTALATLAHVSRATVHHHLKRFQEAGLAVLTPGPGGLVVSPTRLAETRRA